MKHIKISNFGKTHIAEYEQAQEIVDELYGKYYGDFTLEELETAFNNAPPARNWKRRCKPSAWPVKTSPKIRPEGMEIKLAVCDGEKWVREGQFQ